MTQDQTDFIDMLTGLNPTMGAYAKECTERGADPRTIAAGLETAAKTARGWCIGRFGDPTAALTR